MKKTNKRVPDWIARDSDTRKETAGINKVQTYQNIMTATNLDMSRKTVRIESAKKNQGTTRMNITRTNVII